MTTKASSSKAADVPKPEAAPQPAPAADLTSTPISPTEAARIRWEIYKLHHQTNRPVAELIKEAATVAGYVMHAAVPK